ncbi:MAG TPA: hypothetical protein VFJ91_02255 [Gaiellaceae bacterium]|nr:hypothetical protein [Gaiellaceae bacterium]
MSRPATLDELAAEVVERIGRPIDLDAIAATIETLGVRETDARETFGAADVFDLARRVAPLADALAPEEERDAPPPPVVRAALGSARFLRLYGRGIFFALPMIVQVVTIALLRLGTRIHISDAQATAVMTGSILSFLVTGGFVQAIGRLGSVYVGRGNHVLARRLAYRILGLGMLAAAALGALVLALEQGVPLLPGHGTEVAAAYLVILSGLWLSLAVLYMLQQRVLVLVSVGVWVGTFAWLLEGPRAGVYQAQWGGAGAGSAFSGLAGLLVTWRLARRLPAERRQEPLPSARQLAVEVRPYFAYGVLYFAIVFLDRIVGWTKAAPHGYVLFFRGPYELGLDWALLTLLLTVALLDYTITAFADALGPTQRRFAARDLHLHNRAFQYFYLRQLVLLGVLAVLSAAGMYFGGLWLRDAAGSFQEVRDFFADSTTYHVFLWGALGYGLLVWGLLNAVFFFFVSRPAYALRPLAWALLAGVVAGAAASRTGPYWQSVVGLAAGGFVFAAGTTAYAIRLLDEIDFYYYASY